MSWKGFWHEEVSKVSLEAAVYCRLHTCQVSRIERKSHAWEVRLTLSCTQSPNWMYLTFSSSVEGTINWNAPTMINLDDINYYCAKSMYKMMKNYHISQEVAIAHAFIIIFWQKVLYRNMHDDHHVLQERTMNINEKLWILIRKSWILTYKYEY